MAVTTENLRLILGLKVRSLRQARGGSLTDLAERAGVSVSYLSEIENGRKFPKPEVLIRLAEELGVSYEELVSPQLSGELDSLRALVDSEFIKEFPFALFGLEPSDLLGLVSDDPVRAAAFVQTFLEIGRQYDMQVEQFLFAALRSYQGLHGNWFPELEAAAAAFRRERRLTGGDDLEAGLRRILEQEHGYVIDQETLGRRPELAALRSVHVPGDPPRLLVHGALRGSQRAFLYGRELGFLTLGLTERAETGSWVRVESFEQVLNNFKASYFAGALLIDADELVPALEGFLGQPRWNPDGYRGLMKQFHATAEMFAYRLTQVLPGRLGLRKLYFMRFHNDGSDRYELNKVLNMSGIPVPRGVGVAEHYCRRWVTIRLLREAQGERRDSPTAWPRIAGERARFVREEVEFFIMSSARPLRMQETKNTCVTLGFLMDDTFRRTVKFWDDPAVPRHTVGLTCERCPIEDCEVRAAPALVLEQEERQARQLAALAAL